MFLSSACASKWMLKTAQPEAALQWPFAPGRAKLTYVTSLSGLAARNDGGTFVRSLVFGAEDAERNAFVLPVAVATGADGRLAVADLGRHCVHLFLPAEQTYLRLAGAESAPMASPVALTFDDHLQLFVSDSAGRVFAFAANGEQLFSIDKAGSEKLLRPTGVTYSPRTQLIYVVDTLANKVHALRHNGELAFSFGQRGETAGTFNFPTHIARAPSGELYITDALNFRVAIFDEDGKFLDAFGHHGDGSGDLGLPKGIAVDRAGVVYVVDALFDNVQLFDRQGQFLLTLGERGTSFGQFWLPAGAYISENNDLYVCDSYNHRVQIFHVAENYSHG